MRLKLHSLLITCNLRYHRDNSLHPIFVRIQENDKVTAQSNIQRGQKYLYVGNVADFTSFSVLLFV